MQLLGSLGMLPIRNISYLLPMCCSFWEKCINSQKSGLGCSTPLKDVWNNNEMLGIILFCGYHTSLYPAQTFASKSQNVANGITLVNWGHWKKYCSLTLKNLVGYSYLLAKYHVKIPREKKWSIPFLLRVNYLYILWRFQIREQSYCFECPILQCFRNK